MNRLFIKWSIDIVRDRISLFDEVIPQLKYINGQKVNKKYLLRFCYNALLKCIKTNNKQNISRKQKFPEEIINLMRNMDIKEIIESKILKLSFYSLNLLGQLVENKIIDINFNYDGKNILDHYFLTGVTIKIKQIEIFLLSIIMNGFIIKKHYTIDCLKKK